MKHQVDGSSEFWLMPKSESDSVFLVAICTDLKETLATFWTDLWLFWNLGLPLHIWNKATVKAMKTLDSSPPMEVRSSVSGDATEILLVHLLLKTKKGHTLTVQIDATLLWGNINHGQVPWEVNQQGAVLPGQHPCAQVSCCHDCGFKLDYPSMSPDLAPADFNLSWTWRSTCP